MRTTDRIDDVRRFTADARARGQNVGFVPTMGALHPGHVSLIRRARDECDVVVVSIFVNPTQFGPGEDLDAYPRTLDADLAACEREDVDIVFVPGAEEMYPRPPATQIHLEGLTEPMEGVHRPGHFGGVALVVAKLLNIVGPCRAYFGEKDAQQLRVVRRMVEDLNIPAEIVGCPTVREPDGLALSSRNAYLSRGDRERALALSRALVAVSDAVEAGELDAERLRSIGLDELTGTVDAVDYFEIVHPETLAPLDPVDGPVLVCGAVRVGGTRLIDNVTVGGRNVTLRGEGAAAVTGAKGNR